MARAGHVRDPCAGWALVSRSLMLGALLGAFALCVEAATFDKAAVRFDVERLRFDAERLQFDAQALTFPSAMMQTETATTVEVTLSADVLFDFDKSVIRAQAQPEMYELAQLLRSRARGTVQIKGHTDAVGTDPYNDKLSERRAASVKSWLAGQEGLAKLQMSTTGLGARQPAAPNRNPDGTDNPEGRQLNRRVSLVFNK